MLSDGSSPGRLKDLPAAPIPVGALDSDHLKQFLDHIPVAIAVAALQPRERVIYANLEFERLSGQPAAELRGRPWNDVNAVASAKSDDRELCEAITMGADRIGTFRLGPERSAGSSTFDVWSHVIKDEDGAPFRLVALAAVGPRSRTENETVEPHVEERDVLLRELQHRVKNNLQMITSLIRLESYNTTDDEAAKGFNRLAGRVNALALLYRSLSEEKCGQSVDLGAYLSRIALAVMQASAVEGIRLDLRVEPWPVSINVAMPAGLVVNEVLTNALKHAFVRRAGGTITLHSLVDAEGYQISIADDGIGLRAGTGWPTPGRLSALIVQSLRQNAGAQVDISSTAESGLRVCIRLARADAAPEVVERQRACIGLPVSTG